MSRLDFLYRQELPHRAVSVYTYLADRANKDGECWPSITTIAKELKLSQSTVRRALRDLRKAKLIETEQRYRKKGGKSSQRKVNRNDKTKRPSSVNRLRARRMFPHRNEKAFQDRHSRKRIEL